MTFTDWNDPRVRGSWHPHSRTTYIRTKNTKTNITSRSLTWLLHLAKKQQPDLSHNCTGVLLLAHGYPYGWITIPCNYHFNSSFICTERRVHSAKHEIKVAKNRVIKPTASTCEGIKVNMKCFTIFQAGNSSLVDSRAKCRSVGANIIKLKISNIAMNPQILLGDGFDDSEDAMNTVLQTGTYVISTPLMDMYVRGLPVLLNTFTSPVAILMRLLKELSPRMGFTLWVAENNSSSCWKLEWTDAQRLFLKESSDFYGQLLSGWSVRPRPCNHQEHTDLTVCEKDALSIIYTCNAHHFTCQDGTCVLLVYVCDSTNDCPDQSDEKDCTLELAIPEYTTSTRLLVPHRINLGIYTGERSNNNSDFIPIHAFCDGIKTFNDSFEDGCKKNKVERRRFAATDRLKEKRVTWPFGEYQAHHWTMPDLIESETAFFKQRNATLNMSSHQYYSNSSILRNGLQYHRVGCPEGGSSILINDVCQYSKTNEYCYDQSLISLCKKISCSGKFKCPTSYCVPIEQLCDGHNDCIEGEDEELCSNVSCPGLLKCRGETRCLTHDKLCDGVPDCSFSYDDEVSCLDCPQHCTCATYSAECVLVQSKWHLLQHIKGLIFAGSTDTLPNHVFHMKNLIYLRAISCHILSIHKPRSIYQRVPYKQLMFANFSQNNLIDFSFLAAPYFDKLILLDLSFNSVYVMYLDDFTTLASLRYLSISHLPLTYIDFLLFSHFLQLKMVSIDGISWYDINFAVNNEHKLVYEGIILVTDPAMCCFMPDYYTCESSGSRVSCTGLLSTKIHWLLCALTAISIITLFILAYTDMKFSTRNTKKLAFFILTLNKHIAKSCMTAYTLLIVASSLIVNNIYAWRCSDMCKILTNTTIFLEANLTFKLLQIVIVTLKMFYPFEHQCRWIHHTYLLTSLAWLAWIFVSPSLISLIGKQGNICHIADNVCTIFQLTDTEIITTGSISALIVYILDGCIFALGLILCITLPLSIIYVSNTTENSFLKTKGLSISVNILLPLLPELLMRILLWCFLNTSVRERCGTAGILLFSLNVVGSNIFEIIARLVKRKGVRK